MCLSRLHLLGRWHNPSILQSFHSCKVSAWRWTYSTKLRSLRVVDSAVLHSFPELHAVGQCSAALRPLLLEPVFLYRQGTTRRRHTTSALTPAWRRPRYTTSMQDRFPACSSLDAVIECLLSILSFGTDQQAKSGWSIATKPRKAYQTAAAISLILDAPFLPSDSFGASGYLMRLHSAAALSQANAEKPCVDCGHLINLLSWKCCHTLCQLKSILFAVAPGSSSERFEKHRADDKGGESNKVIMPFPLDVRPVLKTETVAPCFDEIEAAVLNTCLTPMGKGAHKDGVRINCTSPDD